MTVPVGAEVLSDPLPGDVPAQSTLAVSIHVVGSAGTVSGHKLAHQTNYISVAGDRAAEDAAGPFATPTTSNAWVESAVVEAALLQHVYARTELLSSLLLRHADAAEGLLDLGRRIARALVIGESGVTAAQYEVYLEASRRPVLRAAVAKAMDAFAGAATPLLTTLGVADPQRGAQALVALTDGLALHRFANPLPVGGCRADCPVHRWPVRGIHARAGEPRGTHRGRQSRACGFAG